MVRILNGLFQLNLESKILGKTGAPNGSVPQNICFSGNVSLAGRCGRNSMTLEGKCCWESDNSGCVKGFDV